MITIVLFFRFGIINVVRALRPIKKGEEFTASYGYKFEHGPLWYQQQFLEYFKTNPNFNSLVISEGKSYEEMLEIFENSKY